MATLREIQAAAGQPISFEELQRTNPEAAYYRQYGQLQSPATGMQVNPGVTTPAGIGTARGEVGGMQGQDIGTQVLQRLRDIQKYGVQQEGIGQREQIGRVFQTPSDLIGASPQLQSSVRNAAVSAVQPTIGGARSLVQEAGNLIKDYQLFQEKQQSQAQDIIDMAIQTGSAGLEELMRVQPDLFKQAGTNIKAYEGILKGLKTKEQEELRRYNISQTKSTGTTEGTTMSPYRAEAVTRMQNSVKDLMNRVGRSTVGYAVLFSGFPSTEARNFANDLKSLQANLAFDALSAMREASKTGGALGQVSERELALLESSVAGLDQGQTPENFVKNLNIINDSINRWLAAASATGGEGSGDDDPLGIR